MPSISRAAAPAKPAKYTLSESIAVSRLYPQLWVQVSAKPDGVHLSATLVPEYEATPDRPRTLMHAVWQPSEVTEQLVVEWAYRALRKLLEDRYEGTGHI